ncbi:MAG: cell division protein FtsA [Spirochaetes bacterium]|nr:cell division protein FtsA [Spirochaetota bacterium]
MADDTIITGLDIGTTKVCAVIGQMNEMGGVDVIGVGTAPSNGLRKGVVVNIDNTVKSINKAIEEAELMAGVEVESVFTGIAGGHIKGINSRGVVAISSKNHEITKADVDRVIDAARAISIPIDREVLHVIPQEYIVDDQDGIKDPVGMSGIRLESEVHIVTGAVSSIENIVKSVHRAGYEVEDIVLEPLASADAILTDEEKELGVVLVDLGGGTTDIIMFINGSVWHSSVIALGGNHVTNDVAIGLRTPVSSAEIIKKKYGCACQDIINADDMIEVPSVGGRKNKQVSRKFLSEIIQPRMEEIIGLVQREIKISGFDELIAAGVVMTGGGSLLEGTVDLAEKVMNLPARIGVPEKIGGLIDTVNNPLYATGVGLVHYGSRNKSYSELYKASGDNLFKNIMKRLGIWFKENF